MAGFGMLVVGLSATAAASDDTWAPAGPLPERLDAPLFALVVDPADGRQVLAGT